MASRKKHPPLSDHEYRRLRELALLALTEAGDGPDTARVPDTKAGPTEFPRIVEYVDCLLAKHPAHPFLLSLKANYMTSIDDERLLLIEAMDSALRMRSWREVQEVWDDMKTFLGRPIV